MRFVALAYKNLHRRRIRSLLTVGGVGVAVAVLVSLLGFNQGYRKALERDVGGLGYEVLITAKGCPYELATVAIQGAGTLRYITDDTVAKIRRDSEVQEITPLLLSPVPVWQGGGFLTFWGIDRTSYLRLRPGLQIATGADGKPLGRWFRVEEVPPDEVVLKSGHVLTGLVMGETEYETTRRRKLTEEQVLAGEEEEYTEVVRTVKVMLPSRIYRTDEIESVRTQKREAGPVDVITLKDGSQVEGIVIERTRDLIRVGNVPLAATAVEEIPKDRVARVVRRLDPAKRPEIVVGYEAAQLGQYKVGQDLRMEVRGPDGTKRLLHFRVAGVLDRAGGKDDGSFFLQLEVAQRLFRRYKQLTGIGIKLQRLERLPAFTDRMYNAKELGEVQVVGMSEVKSTILNLVTTAKILVMSVAAIAIVVALIGVVNTILMSVFERTQEIGIMKAIGASHWHIFKLIWLETLMICTLGGTFGITLAMVGSSAVERLIRSVMSQAGYVPAGQIVEFTPAILAGSFVSAIALGIVSGIWPAFRASRMRPIEAIRSGE
jgi:putative ABC transport system permease protein